jgi:hypothetical protein
MESLSLLFMYGDGFISIIKQKDLLKREEEYSLVYMARTECVLIMITFYVYKNKCKLKQLL